MTAELELKEERYALAVNAIDDGLWDWDLKNNKIFYSNKWKSMLGYNDPEFIGDSPDEWFERLHPDDLEKFQFSVAHYLRERSNRFKAEYRIRHEQGHYLWMLCRGCALWDKAGKPIRFTGFQMDITEKKEIEKQLVYDAFHDPLTGLSNRALFIDRLNQALQGRHYFAILYMDMDHFKHINDTLGHRAGDELLIILARRLEICSRKGDTIARLGGDEFTILLTNVVDTKEVEKVAQRIIKEVSVPFKIEENVINANITIGIAIGNPLHYKHPEEVLRDADVALYQAKERKKGGYEIFTKRMRQLADTHLRIETDLRRDLKKGKIIFYYQPIIDIKKGEIVGFEALLRWEHEQYGVLKSANFLALAEETRLIAMLEQRAFRLAYKKFKILQYHVHNKAFFISFNISEQQLRESDFISNLQKIVKYSEIDPSLFHIEIPERMLSNNPDYMEEILATIKGFGFKLSLDGFGSGYSSLTYLHRYPFDFLKIDFSCILEIDKNPIKRKLVENIIQIAQSLGISVIAEGVESESILNILQELHCPYAQGFHLSQPLSIEKILEFSKKPFLKLNNQ